jgi:16S rRNA (cytidine1402-2'-O)-methyltransferase
MDNPSLGASNNVIKPDFNQALAAAQRAAGAQRYQFGQLYVIATPIGNLADITLRALYTLDLVSTIACEDTRQTRQLLLVYGITKSPSSFIAIHKHNEAQAAQHIIERLKSGDRVAYVSDAGTPAISDPGARLVAMCQAQGLPVTPIPGASSVTAALSIAGLPAQGHYVFEGFLPASGRERASALARLKREPLAVVLLEAPHRISTLASELSAVLGERILTVARELTKQFEQIATLSCGALPAWLAADAQRVRGEFVLIVHPAPQASSAGDGAELDRILGLLLEQLPLKTAVQLACEITGGARNALYTRALAMQAKKPS